MNNRESFRRQLATLINGYSLEGASDTPDFILAAYLDACLRAFDNAVQARAAWHSETGTAAIVPAPPLSPAEPAAKESER